VATDPGVRGDDMEGEDRRRSRTSHRWVWGALALVAVVLLFRSAVRMGWSSQPGWSQRLPDGTLLRLEAVTYGTKHHFEPGLLHLASLRQRLPFLPWAPEFDQTTPQDALLFWMTRRPAAGGRNMGFEWWTYYTAFDEHGCRFGGDGSMTMLSTSPNGSSSSSTGAGGRLAPPSPTEPAVVGYGTLQPFPRRGSGMRLRIYGAGGRPVAEFQVPNPAPGPYPVWNPRPLPQTARDSDLAITLTRFATRLMPRFIEGTDVPFVGADATFRFVWRGRPCAFWEASKPEIEVMDATGNVCWLYQCSLCPYESAWKLRARFFRTDRAPFAPAEVWTIRGVPVPAEGAARRLSGTTILQGKQIELLAIAGAGAFTYRNGAPTPHPSPEARAMRGMPSAWLGSSSTNGIPTTDFSSGQPHLALRMASLPEDWRLTLWAVDDRGRRVANQGGGISDDEHFLSLDIPTGAKRLDLTLALQQARSAEFLIKPPPPPALPRHVAAGGAVPAAGER
jgi:hypothetical protein